MAIFTVSNTGGNYNSGSTWVGGVAPSTADTVAFTSTSGPLTINATTTCAGIDFTNYLNTITFTFILTVAGPCNFGSAGYTVTGANSMTLNTTSTITTNGVAWQGNLTFSGTSQTFTLSNVLTVNGTLLISSTTALTINGFSINVMTNFTLSSNITFSGTTSLIFAGTGTWTQTVAAGNITIPIIFNTSGILTLNNISLRITNNSITYIAGTIVVNNSTIICNGNVTFDTSVINWANITFNGATYTLNSDLIATGKVVLGTSGGVTLNGFTLYVGGDIQIANNVTINGTTNIVLNGAGIWSANGIGVLQNNLTITKYAKIIISGLVYYNTGTLTINSDIGNRNRGSMNIGASTTIVNADLLNLYNITITAGSTLTMNKFFIGTPEIKSNIRSSSTSNYTITFTGTTQVRSFFINIKNCTISTRNQLKVINRDANSGFNQGIMFGERGINGFPSNQFPIEESYPNQNGFLSTLL